MKYTIPLMAACFAASAAVPAAAQDMPALPEAPAADRVVVPEQRQRPTQLQSFEFEQADLDTVMTMYCEWTDKIYLKNDNVQATISLKADRLTIPECIEVVETILAMNNIALVSSGEKFIKVVQTTAPDLVGQGVEINLDTETNVVAAANEKLVTQLIQLKHVRIPEIQTAIQHIMHAFGKIQTLERINALLITDTVGNIKRIRELVEFVDQPTAGIEPRIYQIEYADATEIAAKLTEIITAAQADQDQPAAAVTGNTAVRTPPGVIRARAARQQQANTPTQATISKTEGGSAVIIQGTVKVMADERTNLVLIFSQEENFPFFDKLISVLDVEVEPAITFEVVRLEYADAEELSGTLNELVGAAQGESTSSRSSGSSLSSRSSSSSRNSRSGNTTNTRNTNTRNTNTRSSGSNNAMITPNASPEEGTASIDNLSKLSENTKILADARSNAILLMGRKSDIAAIKNVIRNLDVMLEQVLIEAAIFEVTLGDDLRHGIDWLYRSENRERLGAWDGQNLLNSTNGLGTVAAGALTYYQNLTGINTEIAVNLAASDSNVRLLSTPVVMTTDNTEARLSVGEPRPVVTSTDSCLNSTQLRSSYEYKDIGINLTVTPRINPQRVVVMEILQQADQVGGEVSIDGNEVPIILNREFEAQISVPDRGTVALGGLINTETRDSTTKIPILGDIPLLGRYLFSSVSKENRQTELVVLLTPYVLTTEADMVEETKRLYDATDMQPTDWPEGRWSDTELQLRMVTPDQPIN